MANPQQFLDDAIAAANRGVKFDYERKLEPAIYFYMEAGNLLERAIALSKPQDVRPLHDKMCKYRDRAQSLQTQMQRENADFKGDAKKRILQRFHFLMDQALDADNAGNTDSAIQLYTDAVELCTKHNIQEHETRSLAFRALERIETLRGI